LRCTADQLVFSRSLALNCLPSLRLCRIHSRPEGYGDPRRKKSPLQYHLTNLTPCAKHRVFVSTHSNGVESEEAVSSMRACSYAEEGNCVSLKEQLKFCCEAGAGLFQLEPDCLIGIKFVCVVLGSFVTCLFAQCFTDCLSFADYRLLAFKGPWFSDSFQFLPTSARPSGTCVRWYVWSTTLGRVLPGPCKLVLYSLLTRRTVCVRSAVVVYWSNIYLLWFLWHNKLLFIHSIRKYNFINIVKKCRSFFNKYFKILTKIFINQAFLICLAPLNTSFAKKGKLQERFCCSSAGGGGAGGAIAPRKFWFGRSPGKSCDNLGKNVWKRSQNRLMCINF